MPNIIPNAPTAAPNVPTAPITGGGNKPPVQQPQQPTKPKPLLPPQPVFRRINYGNIGSGQLITFQYLFYKHDPYPLALVTRTVNDKLFAVNLHYLTFRYMKYLINNFCGKVFTYQLIKGDKFVANSFRSYKQEGLRNVKQLDFNYLNQMLNNIRSYNPTEVEAMRQYVKNQLKQKIGKTANDLSGQVVNTMKPGQISGKDTTADARRNPMFGE